MIRGLYTATSGMLVNQAENEVIANNLANVSTAGFKKDIAVFRDFPSQMVHRINDYKEKLNNVAIDFRPPVGMAGTGAVVDEIYTSPEPGPLQFSDNKLDFALVGEGYFAVESESGIKYTRAGTFSVNNEGLLVTQDGNYVLAQEEPVLTTQENVVFDPDGQPVLNVVRMPLSEAGTIDVNQQGQVIIDGQPRFRLAVVQFDDRTALRKVGSNLYDNPEGLAGSARNAFKTMVKQGYVEQSNVSAVGEMVRMINCFRAYEVNQRCITSQDKTLDKAVNTVPRM